MFVSHGCMNYRGSTCKLRNARSAFRNLHVYPLSFIPPWERNKWNWILIFILYQNCTVLATKYPFFNTKHPVIYGRHYSSLHRLMSLHGKMDVKIFLMFIVAENTRSVNIIKSTSLYPLLWINVMLDFICMNYSFHYSWISINTYNSASMKLSMVWFVHTKFCKQ